MFIKSTKKRGENKIEITSLKEKIINDCLESELTYSEVMRALKGAEWYFSSRAETFLKEIEIKKVSEIGITSHTKNSQ